MDERSQRGLDLRAPKKPKPTPHRATGQKPPGGVRPGAGRPRGAQNALERGEVAAIKSMRWRVPENAPAPAAEVAGEAFGALVDVMRRPHMRGSREKLASARAIREEVCGPIKQQVEHSGGVHVTWGFDPTGGAPAEGEQHAQHEPGASAPDGNGGAQPGSGAADGCADAGGAGIQSGRHGDAIASEGGGPSGCAATTASTPVAVDWATDE